MVDVGWGSICMDAWLGMKIIGQMVCGPGEADRWLEDSLKEFKRLCDDAVVVTCNATNKEIGLIKRYGFWTYEDNRTWGENQDKIKSDLLERIAKLHPDWILSLDTDETMRGTTRDDLESITKGRTATYFYVVNLWNDEYHHYRSFWNVRFYALPSESNRRFQRTPLHCGSSPPVAWRQSAKETYVPIILLHKGLMLPDDRRRKAQRYDTYDPSAQYKGREYYDDLVANIQGQQYNEQEVLNEIITFCNGLK